MNFEEFFKADEFKAYRREELNIGVVMVSDFLKGQKSPDYINGAVTMLNKILLVPTTIATGKKGLQLAAAMTAKDLKELQVSMLRRMVTDGD